MALKIWLPFNGNLKNHGLGTDGVGKGNITYSAGKIGQCIDFSANANVASGSENMVVIPGLQLPTFTFCVWIKVTSAATQDDQIIAREGQGYNTDGWSLIINKDTNKIAARASWISHTFPDTGEVNKWYHIAFTHANQVNYWYFNGELIYSADCNRDVTYDTTTTSDGNVITFGARGRDGAYHWPFQGCINDFRLYDEALSPKQIKEISKGLIVHYKLDDGILSGMFSGDSYWYLYDVSGYNNNPLGTNLEIYAEEGHPARYYYQTNFPETSSYIQLPQLTTSEFANSCTIVYWAKISNMNGRMAWGFSNGNRLNIYPTGSVICCNTGDGSSNPYQNNGTSVAFSQWNNGWHQFAMVIDDTTNKLYVDGIYQGTAKTYKAITGTQIYISGWDSGTSYTWTGGQLSDFRIYATALSADEMLRLYKNCGMIDNKGNIYAYDYREGIDYEPV